MLMVMQARGTISAEMRLAGLDFHARFLDTAEALAATLGALGWPAGYCAAEVLGRGRSLKDWARDGWRGAPLDQEAASGILVVALGVLAREPAPDADGKARLLLDGALEGLAARGAEA